MRKSQTMYERDDCDEGGDHTGHEHSTTQIVKE